MHGSQSLIAPEKAGPGASRYRRRAKLLALVAVLALVVTNVAFFFLGHHMAATRQGPDPAVVQNAQTLPAAVDVEPTAVTAHNLLLRKGPHFRIYVRWIQGHLVRTRPDTNPTFDDPDSFILTVQKGMISIALKDLAGFLNAGATGGVGAIANVSVKTKGDQIEIHGTAHKLMPLPVKIVGSLHPLPHGRIEFQVAGLSVLKVPVKGLLGAFRLTLADLTPKSPTPGIVIDGNNLIFDTQKLLPPPHIHGLISQVSVSSDQIHLVFGNASQSDAQLSQWHNFVSFRGGSLGFGRITMKNVDLTMIDASQDPWFDLDLVHYQAQFTRGYSRIIKGAGMEIFLPDAGSVAAKKPQDPVTLGWLEHRDSSLPTDVPVH